MNLNFGIINFAKIAKAKIYIGKLINNKLFNYSFYLDSILKRIETSKVDKIISINNYLYYIDYLSIIENLISESHKSHKISEKLTNLIEIRKKIIFLIGSVGMYSINHIIDFFIKNNKRITDDPCISFYNRTFSPYIVKYEELKKNDKLFYFDQSIDSCSEHIFVKINGLILNIEYYDIKLTIQGYFNNDNFHLYRNHTWIRDNVSKIDILFKKQLGTYKQKFIKQLPLRDIVLYNETNLLDKYTNYGNIYKKNRPKSLIQLIKEVLNDTPFNQRETIISFLLESNGYDAKYFSYILLDIISNGESIYLTLIFRSLHISLQKIIKDTFNSSTKGDINEDNLSYEKRIHLSKAHPKFKAKVFEKLKEINNKSNDTNTKAIQYIDGFLKIPFGTYKENNFTNVFNIFIDNYNNFKRSVYNNQDSHYDYIKEALIENNINIQKVSHFFKTINSQESKEYLYNLGHIQYSDFYNQMSRHKTDIIKKALIKYNFSINGKKELLIQRLYKNRLMYNDLPLEYSQTGDIYREYRLLKDKWNLIVGEYQSYIQFVNETLDKTVYGMKDAKSQLKRIIAQWINGKNDGYCFGLEGPPGTGKTTLAKKGIAKCLQDEKGDDRPFVFIPLGGSSNGSTLEGHNYTYVGSTWGRILDGIMMSKCMNPIIYIDELDKISRTEHGKELVGILIHLTDPSQNNEFMDKYFSGIHIDLSKCLFIFSYNDPSLIDKILLDRIHRIQTKVLHKIDKLEIIKNYLLDDILDTIGYNKEDFIFNDDIIEYIIDNYTLEPGVRKLKEKCFDIFREINLKHLSGEINDFPVNIDHKMVDNILDVNNKLQIKKIDYNPKVGIVNGLFATGSGHGGIINVEAVYTYSETKMSMELTGQQGDVMKESMKVAKSIAWNKLSDSERSRILAKEKFGIHVHCPEGATPKDGPSAGGIITIALISLLSNREVRNDFAMTGEIDLQGNILEIGGLESKIIGATKHGVFNIICPKSNSHDIDKIKSESTLFNQFPINIYMVDHIDEAIKLLFINPTNNKI